MSAAAAIASAASGILGTIINNAWADQRTQVDRRENYLYGEMAADQADKRTRALYNDFYSPQALANQYNAAGLSPSMMFGGTPGQGGMSGAQGTGAAGPQTQFSPISLLEAAQAAQLFAQTKKTEAETKNITADTDLKELQKTWDEYRNNEKSVEFRLSTIYLYNSEDPNNRESIFELAQNVNYETFMQTLKDNKSVQNDQFLKDAIYTEYGQKTLRNIYVSANQFDRDIKVLSEEGVSADFQKKILNVLNQQGYAEQNAKTILAQLESAEQGANLSKEQSASWNHLIEKLRKKNSTAADIAIVLCMIFNQAASNWVSTGVKLGGK